MGNIEFLKKKFIEEKIKFNELSNDISLAYISNSDDEIKASKIMLKQGLYKQSIIHSYYSMYMILQSLLFKCGIKCEDHNASIVILNEIFEKDIYQINRLKKERIDVQYYITKDIDKEFTKELLVIAEEFVLDFKCFIDEMTEKSVLDFRTRLKNILLD